MNEPTSTNVLIDRARIRGATRMIAQGTDPKDVSPEQIQIVAADVESFCKANGITKKDVARAVGVSPGVISEFCTGSYRGNNGQLAIDLESWLTEEETRRQNQQKTTFVWTSVARCIQGAAAYCLDMKKVGLVYGPETSGLGKTTAMLAIAQEMGPRRAAMVTIDKADASPTALLKKIMLALGVGIQGSSTALMRDRIVEHLKGRSHLLLIDQVHNLRFAKEDRPLYFLMDIYEATQSAQLWAGTSDMVAYLQRQQSKTTDEPLAQIRRRIFPCIDLMEQCGGGGGGGDGSPLYTVDDIREMFSKFKLKLTPSAARWLCCLARSPGSGALGICVNLVEYAVMLAESQGLKAIDLPQIKQALKCSLSIERANKLMAQAEAVMNTDRALKVA
jgi:DNA transposition AAA+ family ATPase